MRVIGTAGHVDHGKTALIRSLTGIDADRLPEEKARGMTTDLGFAWYEGESGEPIGVVDVPGHERYLRNMVAGAWGLDLVVLVVAADDGWMPQTSLHASIVASLSAPGVVLAVTKADAVPPGRPEAVATDAIDRAAALFGFRPEAVPVSNVSGSGIAELKAAIDRALGLRPAEPKGKAMLYVDRVFSPLGGGIVVTGTLKSGELAVGSELELYPRGGRVRVRGVQSYHADLERAIPVCRAALSISGARSGIGRGDLLAEPGAAIFSDTEFLCRLLPMPGTAETCPKDAKGRSLLRNGMEAEIAMGSARGDVDLWQLRPSYYVRVVAREAIACPAGAAFVLLRRGGAGIVGRGVVVRAGTTGPADRKALAAALPVAAAAADALESSGWGLRDALAQRLAVEAFGHGWAMARGGMTVGLAATAGFEAAASADGAVAVFDPLRWSRLKAAVLSAAGEPGGLSWATADSLFARAFPAGGLVPGGDADSRDEWNSSSAASFRAAQEAALRAALDRLEAEKTIARDGPAWKSAGAARNLSSEEAAVLSRLRAAGKAGLEPGKTTQQADARALKALCSFGEARPLDGGIFMVRQAFDDCVAAILLGKKSGDRFTVGDAKERSGLSRKYILPLLNRMESIGLVKRSGDERVVI